MYRETENRYIPLDGEDEVHNETPDNLLVLQENVYFSV